MERHPFLDADRPIAIAHRGGAGTAPENTIDAFRAAHEMGFAYLETDVHLTADGEVVAFHDPLLDRVTDRTGRIADMTWPEVADAVVGGTSRVPRLLDLLTEFPDARFNIDAKSDAVVEPLVRIVEHARAQHRVLIASFSHKRLRLVRSLSRDRLCTSASQYGIATSWLRALGLPAPRTDAHVLQAPSRFGRATVVNKRFVDRAHADGLLVHVWTVDQPEEMVRLLDMGVDGLMTDQPAVLKEVFESRGIW